MGIFGKRFPRIALLMFTTIAPATSALAASFSEASVKGGYGFMTVLWSANPKTPTFGMVGVMTFDGAGHMSATYSSNTGGVVKTGAWGGSYSVNADGSGAIDVTAGGTANFAITLHSTAAGVAHGLQLLLTDDSNNEVVSGTATLQSANAQTYGVASLKGSFALLANPWNATSKDKAEGVTGLLTFDGGGKGKSVATIVYGGAVVAAKSETFTYSVDAKGAGSLALQNGASWAFALNSVAAGQAEELQILVTGSPDLVHGALVLGGTAMAQ